MPASAVHGSGCEAEGAKPAERRQAEACGVKERCSAAGSPGGAALRLPQIKLGGGAAEPLAERRRWAARAARSNHRSGCHSARVCAGRAATEMTGLVASARHQRHAARGSDLRNAGAPKQAAGSLGGLGGGGSSSSSSSAAEPPIPGRTTSPLPSLLSSIGRWRRDCAPHPSQGPADSKTQAELPGNGPLAAFTKLKVGGELLPVIGIEDDSPAGSERWSALLEHGLLAREVFERYGAGNDGKLGVPELHWLLRDHGIKLDYAGTCRALSGVTNQGEQRIDFEGFARVVAEAGTPNRGYTEEVIILLHCVFNSYDRNSSGLLERQEFLKLLKDAGHRTETADELAQSLKLISNCRPDGVVGPLTFDHFLALLQKLNGQWHSREEDDTLLS